MADLGTGAHWLVSPDAEAEKQWIKVGINERLSRIRATEAAIDDLEKIQKEKLKHNLMMLRQELAGLQVEYKKVEGKVIEAEVTEG